MEHAQQYLLDYLMEEFRRYPEVRVRPTPSTEEEGVRVKTESREYFFPAEWMGTRNFDRIQAEIRAIKSVLPDRG